jgi:UPF0716 family protein affecting phage T7 exclusion
MLFFPRLRPFTLLLFAASWIIFEWLLFSAMARQIGSFGAIVFYVAKGGLGLILLMIVVRRVGTGLSKALRDGRISQSAGELFASIIGAMLIALPGLIPSFFGLALFSPSLRKRCAAFFMRRTMADEERRPRSRQGRDVDLDRSEWSNES